MTQEKEPSTEAWDRLFDPESDGGAPALEPDAVDPASGVAVRTPAILASAWADLVLIGAVTTAALAGVSFFGYPLALRALPWAAATAFIWWAGVAVVLITVRRATPGMVVAGLVFDDHVAGIRVIGVVVVAAFCAISLGIPLLVGGGARSVLAAAAGSPLAQA